jgi:hypothetical protein
VKRRCTIFHAWVGPVRIPQKSRRDTLRETCVLHSVGSTGHVVHFGAFGARNIDALLIMHGCDPYGFHQNGSGTRYAKPVFLHLVASTGHVVHYGTFVAQNIDAQFCMLGWDRYGFHKKHAGSIFAEHVLLHRVGIVCRVVHYGASRA